MKKKYKGLFCLCLPAAIWAFAGFPGLSSFPVTAGPGNSLIGSLGPIASTSSGSVLRASFPFMQPAGPVRKQFALLMSLKPDTSLIARYKAYHRHVWPAVENAFRKAGILDFKIFLFGYQTFLLVETSASFNGDTDFDKISGPVIDQWNTLMGNFQQISGREKWMPVELIYHMQ